MAGVLGQGPAVLAGQWCEQGGDQVAGAGSGLGSGQVRVDDGGDRFVQQVGPALGRYAGGCGHRLLFRCLHNHR